MGNIIYTYEAIIEKLKSENNQDVINVLNYLFKRYKFVLKDRFYEEILSQKNIDRIIRYTINQLPEKVLNKKIKCQEDLDGFVINLTEDLCCIVLYSLGEEDIGNKIFCKLEKECMYIFKSIVKREGGTGQDAEDVFQGALIELFTKIKFGGVIYNTQNLLETFALRTSMKVYFLNELLKPMWKIFKKDPLCELNDNIAITNSEDFFNELFCENIERIKYFVPNRQIKKFNIIFDNDLRDADKAKALGYKNTGVVRKERNRFINMIIGSILTKIDTTKMEPISYKVLIFIYVQKYSKKKTASLLGISGSGLNSIIKKALDKLFNIFSNLKIK